jgi:hypothetical protein
MPDDELSRFMSFVFRHGTVEQWDALAAMLDAFWKREKVDPQPAPTHAMHSPSDTR